MSEENKALARRFFEEVHSKGNLAVVDEIFATDFVFHAAREDVRSSEGVKQRISAYRTGFPDLRATIEDQIAEADKVVTRVTWHGTHNGDFRGTAPTNKQVQWSGVVIFRIAGGKIMERWGNLDRLGIMEQIGAVPASP